MQEIDTLVLELQTLKTGTFNGSSYTDTMIHETIDGLVRQVHEVGECGHEFCIASGVTILALVVMSGSNPRDRFEYLVVETFARAIEQLKSAAMDEALKNILDNN